METAVENVMTVEGQIATESALAQIVRFEFKGAGDFILNARQSYLLNFCLTPRPDNARASYHQYWGPHRFERLGDIFMIPPGQEIHIRNDAGGTQAAIVCTLDEDIIERWLDGGIEWTEKRLEASLDITSPHVRALMFRLAEEARHPGFGSEILSELLIGQLAIELGRFCVATREGPVAGGLASWRLRLIDERLQQVGAPPSLDDLAALCNISVRQLTRGFRASRGVSIGAHVEQTRIDHAKRLLAGPDTIKAIAFNMGYASASNFSHAFRRATGATPRQYRQRLLRVQF